MFFPKSWFVFCLASSITALTRVLVLNKYMPMEASAASGLFGEGIGSEGFLEIQ